MRSALKISYQMKDESYCKVEFRGTPSEARHVIDFAKPQLAAADDSVAKVTVTFAFSEPIDAEGIEKLGQQLGHVSPGAVSVEASA